MPAQTVLVLGGGTGGLAAAGELRRLLPGHRITVVDRLPRASYAPSYAALAVGETKAGSIVRPRARLARKGIECINAEVQHIDLDRAHVRAEGRDLRYDYLVLALGSEADLDAIPGLAESAQSFSTLDAVERLAATLRYFAGGRVLITVPEGPSKWAPATYELAMLLEQHFHVRRMRQRVDITITTPEEAPLALFGAEVSALIAGQLAHKGIEFYGGTAPVWVDTVRRHVRLSDGSERPFDLLISVPPEGPPRTVIESGLASTDGWPTVAPSTFATSADRVYALGGLLPPASLGGSIAGGLPSQQGLAAARQIASRIEGRHPRAPSWNARWFIEVGAGAATMVSGDHSGRALSLRATQPSILWHWAKTLREKAWLYGNW